MTIKERIIQELEHTPDVLLEQVFNFLRFLKSTYFLGNLPETTAVDEASVISQSTAPPPSTVSPKLSEAEKLERLNQLFGAWANQPDLDGIFSEIDRDRHAYRGRQIDALND